jgi:hypothetical protein
MRGTKYINPHPIPVKAPKNSINRLKFFWYDANYIPPSDIALPRKIRILGLTLFLRRYVPN